MGAINGILMGVYAVVNVGACCCGVPTNCVQSENRNKYRNISSKKVSFYMPEKCSLMHKPVIAL